MVALDVGAVRSPPGGRSASTGHGPPGPAGEPCAADPASAELMPAWMARARRRDILHRRRIAGSSANSSALGRAQAGPARPKLGLVAMPLPGHGRSQGGHRGRGPWTTRPSHGVGCRPTPGCSVKLRGRLVRARTSRTPDGVAGGVAVVRKKPGVERADHRLVVLVDLRGRTATRRCRRRPGFPSRQRSEDDQAQVGPERAGQSAHLASNEIGWTGRAREERPEATCSGSRKRDDGGTARSTTPSATRSGSNRDACAWLIPANWAMVRRFSSAGRSLDQNRSTRPWAPGNGLRSAAGSPPVRLIDKQQIWNNYSIYTDQRQSGVQGGRTAP